MDLILFNILRDHDYLRQPPILEEVEIQQVPIQEEDEEFRDGVDELLPFGHDGDEELLPLGRNGVGELLPLGRDGADELLRFGHDEVLVRQPETYSTLPGIHQNSKIYVDNLGFKYHKREARISTISLICARKRSTNLPECNGTASISRDVLDNRITIRRPHNHIPDDIDLNVPFLREAISERALDPATPSTTRNLYNTEIIRHREAARNYTHQQAYRRVCRMKSLRRPSIPKDLHELALALTNPQYPSYGRTLQNPPSVFFQQELVVNERTVGLVFANRDAIELYRGELNTVTLVGVDGTFKTVPGHPADLKCLLTIQVHYKDVAFPMIYVLLNSMTEETYCAMFTIMRRILPLNYDTVRFVTDYERALMNAITQIFPTSKLVCCWFHYTQSIVRYCHRRMNSVLDLVKTDDTAARIFRMVLALPHLPATRNNPRCPEFCVLDGYRAIVQYAQQFPEIHVLIEGFLNNYIFGFWIEQIGPKRFSVFGEEHRTNNILESFHSTLLRQMGTHPNIWDFLQKIKMIENQFFIEFDQRRRNLMIRDMKSRSVRANATRIIRESVQQLNRDHDLLAFLRRTGHQNDGYVQRQIGQYPPVE